MTGKSSTINWALWVSVVLVLVFLGVASYKLAMLKHLRTIDWVAIVFLGPLFAFVVSFFIPLPHIRPSLGISPFLVLLVLPRWRPEWRAKAEFGKEWRSRLVKSFSTPDPPGWYRVPDNEDLLQRWDGSNWKESFIRLDGSPLVTSELARPWGKSERVIMEDWRSLYAQAEERLTP